MVIDCGISTHLILNLQIPRGLQLRWWNDKRRIHEYEVALNYILCWHRNVGAVEADEMNDKGFV